MWTLGTPGELQRAFSVSSAHMPVTCEGCAHTTMGKDGGNPTEPIAKQGRPSGRSYLFSKGITLQTDKHQPTIICI